MGRRARPILVAAALALMLAGGTATAASRAPTKVFVRTAIDGGGLAVRPEAIALSVHGSLSVHALRWDGWGGAVARGRGRARVHGCVPDCNLGKIEYLRVRVRLSEVTECEGRLVYGRLGYRLGGQVPAGVERGGRFDMRPEGC